MKEPAQQTTVKQTVKLHHVRCYNLTPRSIQCMAYNKISHKLALSRNNGSIEIWDMQHAAILEKIIPTTPGNSVEGMVWSGERLFSGGLNGELVEWDLQVLHPRRKQHVTGNAIWCLDVNAEGTELAIGTEEGFINMFNIAEDEFQYKQLLDKQAGRVLCCKYDKTGEFLVTGSMGALRLWNVRTGYAVHRMTVARADKKREVIIWSLQVLSDFTIISGDSRGIVTFWDGHTGAEIKWHQVLKADVLTLAVNEQEDLLMCAGIEPIIRIYTKTEIKRPEASFHMWVKFLQRSVHEHDVKALVCVGERILSGGIDGYLGVSSSLKTSKMGIVKYGPFLQNPCAVLAPLNRLILLRYANHLEIWRLGSSDSTNPTAAGGESEMAFHNQTTKQKLLPITDLPEKVLEFRSKEDKAIICAALSPDGIFMCYSTPDDIRIFRFTLGTPGKLVRIRSLPEEIHAAAQLQFSADGGRLFMIDAKTRQILILTVPDFDCIECIETRKHIKDTVRSLVISNCGLYIVVSDTAYTNAVWYANDGKKFKHLLNLPRYSAATAAVALHSHQPRLVVAYTDGKIIEYDLDEMCFTCSDILPNVQAHCVKSILTDENDTERLLVINDCDFMELKKYTIKETADDSATPEVAKKKGKKSKVAKTSTSENTISALALKQRKSNEHFLQLSRLNAQEIIAVGINDVSLIEQLPDAFKKNKFGTK